ncbi:hypothetical protein WM40_22690 [Robbsia andropogonis]|uniref:N-acetyltransferase domain-containing protein n=1 Tax=Robbsia andropogonis TaxID=28092 RepID=A0A0F5JV73_9BURK|nr:GNAT family protein [Robbsia andropogonis]KKB61550.1 hypothetical protein WM40_22690 [Robbsia andropogonis]
MLQLVFDHDRVGPWVCDRLEHRFERDSSTSIGMTRDGVLMCGVYYDDYNHSSICMHVAKEGAHWLNRQFLTAVFRYPFVQLKVKKLIGLVDSTNVAARRFDEKLGFHLEATVKDAARYGDLLIYTMRPDTCRWLGGKNG